MYAVKAKKTVTYPVRQGGEPVTWPINQVRLVDDELILKIGQDHADVFEVLAGPDDAAAAAALVQAATATAALRLGSNDVSVVMNEGEPENGAEAALQSSSSMLPVTSTDSSTLLPVPCTIATCM